MNDTPECIKKYFENNNINKYKIIEKNDWKGRLYFEFIKDDIKYFLKYNDSSPEYNTHIETFSLERNIYEKLNNEKFMIESKVVDDFLIVPFLDNFLTIRELIKSGKNLPNEKIFDLFSDWKEFNEKIELNEIKLKNVSAFEDYKIDLSSLLLSGPSGGGNRLSGITKLVNRIMRKTIFFYSKIFLKKDIDDCHLKCIHGDFHLNNVSISENKIYLIDFENVHKGSREVELAYFCSQLFLLLNQKERQYQIENFIKQSNIVENFELYKKITNIYCLAIRFNPTFK